MFDAMLAINDVPLELLVMGSGPVENGGRPAASG